MRLVISCSFLVGLCVCFGASVKVPSVDTMKSGVSNFADLHASLKDAKPKQIVSSVGNLLAMVPVPCFQIFGVALLLFSALIDDSTPDTAMPATQVVDNREVLAKLNEVNGNVLTLMRSVEEMGQELEIKISEQTVLEKERSLRVLSDIFLALQKTRSRTYWNIMKQSCIQVNFFGLPGFFRDELLGTAPTSSGFMKELRENQEYTKYERGIHRLIGGFYTASLMHAACTVITSDVNNVTALIANIEDIDKLVSNIDSDEVINSESGSVFKSTIDYNKRLLNNMIKDINSSADAVRQDFEKNSFTWAKEMVIKEATFMNKTGVDNDTYIVELLHSKLSTKYPWRPWMVAVFRHPLTGKMEPEPENDESKRTELYASAFHGFDNLIENKIIVIASVESEGNTLEERTWKDNVTRCHKINEACDDRIECDMDFFYFGRMYWGYMQERLGKCVGKYFGNLYYVSYVEPKLVVKTSKDMERFVYHNTVRYGIGLGGEYASYATFIFTY